MISTTETQSFLNSMYTTDTTTSSELDSDAFLKLFVAQLENQDPLDPMDDTESLSQLAEFASLEQLTNLSTSLDGIAAALGEMQQMSAAGYIGKDVLAAGNAVSLADGAATEVTYVVPSDATGVIAHIYDEDGTLVRSVEIGDLDAGEYEFTWDGKDTNGNTCVDGNYAVKFTAENAEGESISISTLVEGTVSGVAVSDGSIVLTLDDGREVALLDVYSVSDHVDDTAEADDTTDDETGDTAEDDSDTTEDDTAA